MKKLLFAGLLGLGLSVGFCADSSYMIDKPSFMISKRSYYKKHIQPTLQTLDYQYKACAVKKLEDQDQVYPNALDMMRRAKKSILFNMYLFGGKIGDDVIEVAKQKMDEGVAVYFVLSKTKQSYEDAEKARAKTVTMLAEAEERGEPIEKPPYLQTISKAKEVGIPVVHADFWFIDANVPVRIDHDKLIITDGVEAMIGGMNFATTTAKNRDAMVHVVGPMVEELEKSFVNNWLMGYGKPMADMMQYDEATATEAMNEYAQRDEYSINDGRVTLTSAYVKNTRPELTKMFDNAKESIVIEQLLLNDTDILETLAKAALRGVKIRLLLDPAEHLYYRDWHGGPNNKAIAVFEELKKRHPELDVAWRHYKVGAGAELHMKMSIVDGKILGIGSTNFTSGAFNSNFEMFGFFKGQIVEDFKAMFENDWKNHSKPAPHVGLGRKVIAWFSDRIF
ncbi:MAG: phosphatidylserine/phosphatidylglycerophosphate/cardiolipin synthase family protein [Candidatus Cloacimonetes bacterium]|nr:phosphatidylserine/phosphatidylglycerophosphate/cardiolipin synthase family protein [Candidatus Cloacimonadota bacterium]